MTDLRTYSEQHVGRQWTELDHLFLSQQLTQIDKLAQDLANLREAK